MATTENKTPTLPAPGENAPGVTVLSGFLGAGKTTLLKKLLKHAADIGVHLGLVVNDMATFNVDADIVNRATRGGGAVNTEAKIVQMEGGCICCTLREDLLIEVKKMVAEKRLDYILIESTGVSEPLPVAETFTFAPLGETELSPQNEEATPKHDHKHDHTKKEGDDEMTTGNAMAVLGDVARLDCMVTVVDVTSFYRDLNSVQNLIERFGDEVEGEDNRTVSTLLIDQIEFANVVILNKVSSLPKENAEMSLKAVRGIVHRLNPTARVIETDYSTVDFDQVINTKLFSFEKAMEAPGWLKEVRGEHVPETEEYGISSFVWTARRPLHPKRTFTLVNSGSQEIRKTGLVRAKGLAWLACNRDYAFYLQGAGEMWGIEPATLWEAALPPDERYAGLDPGEKAFVMSEEWIEPYGDRSQKIVMIGQFKEGPETLRKMFDECLLTDEEFAEGPDKWAEYEDPFFSAEMFEDDEDGESEEDDESDEDDEDGESDEDDNMEEGG